MTANDALDRAVSKVMEDERDQAQQLVRLAQRELLEAANQLRAMRDYPPLPELATRHGIFYSRGSVSRH